MTHTIFIILILVSNFLHAKQIESIAINDYANYAIKKYKNTLSLINQNLKPNIQNLIKNPTAEHLRLARESWIQAISAHIETEVYRFYGGPIDGDEGPERYINSWPIDESFIDYVEGNLTSGIINNLMDYPEIDANLLIQINEFGGDTNISTGFHAIEFLLWGQDKAKNAPGDRKASDFNPTQSANAERRIKYLSETVNLLEKSVAKVIKIWEQTYLNKMINEPEIDALTKMFKGVFKLAGEELAHERMRVPYETKDQEDEHSCFSDTTHLNHLSDVAGLKNVLLGSKGTNGLISLIETKDSNLAKKIKLDLLNSQLDLESITPPFDQAIVNEKERSKIDSAIKNLESLADHIQIAAKLWDLKIN